MARAHQEFLIRAARSASADVSTLQAYLLGHSARVAKLSKLHAGRGTAQREQTEPVIHGYGFASRKSFTIGTMMGMRCISVT